ncbi:MAG: DUF1330 domain-containing protein [Hyphomicrobiales bacterium]|nr:DUF1330 domain-containing protein [Hyphomicrobiales bacterium]MCP4999821.1 DUF1330 domain-containing protein [Hyphomicrobiales bacterium]
MGALMIARIKVKDPHKFQEYITGSKQVATPYGAKLVYQGKVVRTLNGEDNHEIVVIAEFPDADHINDWFDSDAYQPLVALREEAADMHMTNYQVIS